MRQNAFNKKAEAAVPKRLSEIQYNDLVKFFHGQCLATHVPLGAPFQFSKLKQEIDDIGNFVRQLYHQAGLRDQFVFGLANRVPIKNFESGKRLAEELKNT